MAEQKEQPLFPEHTEIKTMRKDLKKTRDFGFSRPLEKIVKPEILDQIYQKIPTRAPITSAPPKPSTFDKSMVDKAEKVLPTQPTFKATPQPKAQAPWQSPTKTQIPVQAPQAAIKPPAQTQAPPLHLDPRPPIPKPEPKIEVKPQPPIKPPAPEPKPVPTPPPPPSPAPKVEPRPHQAPAKEKAFLKGASEETKEKLKSAAKSEEEQRRRFMEDIEKWASSGQ